MSCTPAPILKSNGHTGWSFTWTRHGSSVVDSVVTIELSARDGGTHLTLTHNRLPDEATAEAHVGGWIVFLENLRRHLATSGAT